MGVAIVAIAFRMPVRFSVGKGRLEMTAVKLPDEGGGEPEKTRDAAQTPGGIGSHVSTANSAESQAASQTPA